MNLVRSIECLKVGQEYTILRHGPIERRVFRPRRHPNLFQIYDINHETRQCWHLVFEQTPTMTAKKAELMDSPFMKRWAFKRVKRAKGWQAKENRLLNQRIFWNQRKEAIRPQLIVIKGGKTGLN